MNIPDSYWSAEPPTKPGWYLWSRCGHRHHLVLFDETQEGLFGFSTDGLSGFAVELGGLWCRLVPAREVERAFREAVKSYCERPFPSPTTDYLWRHSRAKRVMEGE